MQDGDYERLINGELTREEMEYVLAYGPEELSEQGPDDQTLLLAVNALCQGAGEETGPIRDYGYDAQYCSQYDVDDVNRLLLSFTDFQLSEDNTGDNAKSDYFVTTHVDGNVLSFFPATLNYISDAAITSAEYTADPDDPVFYLARHLLRPGREGSQR